MYSTYSTCTSTFFFPSLSFSRYTATTKSLSNRFVHLTNYSINKKNVTFEQNPDETVCQGHKWYICRYIRMCTYYMYCCLIQHLCAHTYVYSETTMTVLPTCVHICYIIPCARKFSRTQHWRIFAVLNYSRMQNFSNSRILHWILY